MFSDGAFLFDAGWLFFAAWCLILIAFFVIAFGEDLWREQQGSADNVVSSTQGPLHSSSSHGR